MNPSSLRGLVVLSSLVAASSLMVSRPTSDDSLSDEDFISAYNAKYPQPEPYIAQEPIHRRRTSGHDNKHVASYESPPRNTEHEMAAWERRRARKTGNSLLDKARRAKGRR